MPGTIRSNHIVRQVDLTEGGVLLDGLADGDATANHCFVVSHIKNKQILLVSKHFSNSVGALLADLAVGKVQVGQGLVVADALCEQLCALCANLVVIKQELGQEPLVAEGAGQLGDRGGCDTSVGKRDNSHSLNVSQSLSNPHETLVANRVVVQVQLAQFVLVGEHFTQGRGAFTGYLVVLQMQ